MADPPVNATRSAVLSTLLAIAGAGTSEHALALDAARAASNAVADRSSQSFYSTPFSRTPTVAEMAALGRRMFFDTNLSASRRLSCAGCHDPGHAYAPANASPVQRGGLAGAAKGLRAVPSLRYQQSVPPFTEHRHEAEGDDSIDQGPAGGRTWDGRAQSAHDQARLPLLSSREMANGSAAAVAARLERASYAGALRDAFG